MPVFGYLYRVLFEVVRSNGGVCHGPFEGWRTPWIVWCLWTPEALDPVDKAKQDSYSECIIEPIVWICIKLTHSGIGG